MKKENKKYFALIWATIVIAYNSILFLLVATLSKDVFKTTTFWVLYVWMMSALIIWLLAGIFEGGNLKFLTTFTYPYIAIVFVLTTILYFYATKIDKVAFIIIPMIFFSAILLIIMLLGMLNKKIVKNNSQQSIHIKKVEELSAFFMEISKNCNGYFKEIVDDLAIKCQSLTSCSDEKAKILDQRLIEYAGYIKKNAINEEMNIENNVKKFENILMERVK